MKIPRKSKKQSETFRFQKIIQLDTVVILPVMLVLQAFLLALFMQVVTFADYNVLYQWFNTENIGYVLYNVLLYYLVLQLWFCLLKRVTPGYLITTLLVTLISVVNNMKWVSLKECVTLSDLEKLEEALTVAGKAEFKMFKDLWIGILVGIVLLVINLIADKKLLFRIRKDASRIYTCRMTLVLLAVILIPMIWVDAKGSAVAKLTESRTADKTGPVVYFIESMFTSYLEEPYTTEEAVASYKKYVTMGKEIASNKSSSDGMVTLNESSIVKPNVIVIMSEAFYDVNYFEGVLSYSENPMAYYEEVEKESVVSGNTRVNIFGGSTHFSEFEFLTGWNSKGMNSGSCPYKEYFNVKQPSLARYMQEQGYYTLAIHPYDSYFWNRKNAYPNMGFDRFIDRSWMKYTDKCGYISDDALTNEIIYRYEERQENDDEPFFCFGVSIANHVAMINREEFENTATHIEVDGLEKLGYTKRRQQRVKEYIGGISKSGEALVKLTEYFKEQEKPTVIVFFGDHASNYTTDILEKAGKEELSYQTPYLIWSNYELDKKEVGSESTEDMTVSYLSTYILQLLNMPLPEQSYYNIALRNQYMYDTRYGISDWDGKLYQQFSKQEKDVYFEYALDMKKYIPALLEKSETIQNIWSVPK